MRIFKKEIAATLGGSASESQLASSGWGISPQIPALLLLFTDIDLSKVRF